MSEPGTVEVRTATGTVIGRARGGVIDFAGVRYGDRLSEDRFAELGAPRSAQSEAAAFPQRPGALDALLGGALGELPQSEDAFVLRIQAPAGAESGAGLPVLVFIPGGGFLSGAAHARWFEGSPLVAEGPLLLVTVNYRIGALGHLGPAGEPAEANRGLRDLGHALRWIHENIAAFGGDPQRITLAGDSAGAWYAHALSVSPDTAGLFARTALISFPYEPPLDESGYAARRAVALGKLEELEKLGALEESGAFEESGATPVDLAAQRTERLLDAQLAVARAFAGKGMALMPAANGAEVPGDIASADVQAPRLHVEALALLTTSEEAAAFLRAAPEEAFPPPAVEGYIAGHFADPAAAQRLLAAKRPEATAKERMIDAMTLFQFRTAALELAAAATSAGTSSWIAQLGLQSPLDRAYSPHCFTLPFIFGNRVGWHDAPMLEGIGEEEFARTSELLREWLLGFVRGGAPRVAGEDQPAFDPAAPRSLEIDADGARLDAPVEWGLRARRAETGDPAAKAGASE